MGTGVAVGGAGVNVAVGVAVGAGFKKEAHEESPSAIQRIKDMVLMYFQDIRMNL